MRTDEADFRCRWRSFIYKKTTQGKTFLNYWLKKSTGNQDDRSQELRSGQPLEEEEKTLVKLKELTSPNIPFMGISSIWVEYY